MILGIICFLLFIVSFLIFAYYYDEDNYIGMISGIFVMIFSGLGIITFIYINAEKIVSWFIV